MTKPTFEQLTTLYKAMQWNNDFTEAELLLTNVQILDLVETILDDSHEYGITQASGALSVGSLVKLYVGLPRTALGLVSKDFCDLLQNQRNCHVEPKNYYLISEKFARGDLPVPIVISIYRSVVRFVDLLKECADYFDKTFCELVFLQDEAMKLPVKYDEADLKLVDLEALNSLSVLFSDDTHREQKLQMLAAGIRNLCVDKVANERFSSLLRDLPTLKDHLDKSYRLFVSGFSYDRVVDQLRTAKIEETSKIHKTFSDVQNHILSIPVATFIVVTQMKMTTSFDTQVIMNTGVLFGAILFTVLTFFVFSNQLHTLRVIKEEWEFKVKQIQSTYQSIEGDIKPHLDHIGSRLKLQKCAFITILAFIFLGCIATICAYFYFTPLAKNFICEFLLIFCFLIVALLSAYVE